jgi:hypothetical protein
MNEEKTIPLRTARRQGILLALFVGIAFGTAGFNLAQRNIHKQIDELNIEVYDAEKKMNEYSLKIDKIDSIRNKMDSLRNRQDSMIQYLLRQIKKDSIKINLPVSNNNTRTS